MTYYTVDSISETSIDYSVKWGSGISVGLPRPRLTPAEGRPTDTPLPWLRPPGAEVLYFRGAERLCMDEMPFVSAL